MKKVLVVLAVLMFTASLAYAAECKICSNLNSDDPAKVGGSRIGNGLANGLFGWTEIFFRPGKVSAEGGNPIIGVFRGLGNAITRTVVGATEVVTFWTPGESVASMPDCPLCAYSSGK